MIPKELGFMDSGTGAQTAAGSFVKNNKTILCNANRNLCGNSNHLVILNDRVLNVGPCATKLAVQVSGYGSQPTKIIQREHIHICITLRCGTEKTTLTKQVYVICPVMFLRYVHTISTLKLAKQIICWFGKDDMPVSWWDSSCGSCAGVVCVCVRLSSSLKKCHSPYHLGKITDRMCLFLWLPQ